MKNTEYTITGKAKLQLVKEVLENLDKSKSVLCVGGNKYDLAFIKSFGFNKVLVSNNSEIELAECGQEGVLFDITETLPKIGKFDVIVFMDVLEHLINPDVAIVNINKLLKDGGLLIITTPNLACFFNRIFLLLGWSLPNYTAATIKTGNPLIKAKIGASFRKSYPHKSVFTQKQLKELLVLYGFKILRQDGFHYGADLPTKAGGNYSTIRKIFNKILPISMREGIFFVCKKMFEVETDELIRKFSVYS